MSLPLTDYSSQVFEALRNDPRTKNHYKDIEVAVDRGILTLTGSVPNTQASDAAEEIARNTPGIISVHNELKIKGR